MNAIETLRAYSRKEANDDDVMRALVSHEDWLVTAPYGQHVMKTDRFSKSLLLGNSCNVPPGRLWVFTDEAAANALVEQGAEIGLYVGGIPGTRLFALLPTNYLVLTVNIASPESESWIIEQSAFAMAALWAHAVALEKHLVMEDGSQKFGSMRAYPAYLYLTHPDDGSIVALADTASKTRPAMVFTARDCVQKFLQRTGGMSLDMQFADAAKLFNLIKDGGFDGVIFNAAGPGQSAVFNMDICDKVLAAEPNADL